MPYQIEKRGTSYEVINEDTGRVHAFHTTKKKAEAQVRLLQGIEHGMVPKKGSGKKKPQQMEAESESESDTEDSKMGCGKKPHSWIAFWSSKCKGKKFKSRAEINAYMKEMSKEYHSKKGTGQSLLLAPGHAATTSKYTQGFDVRTI